jgi:hypothetical protein
MDIKKIATIAGEEGRIEIGYDGHSLYEGTGEDAIKLDHFCAPSELVILLSALWGSGDWDLEIEEEILFGGR